MLCSLTADWQDWSGLATEYASRPRRTSLLFADLDYQEGEPSAEPNGSHTKMAAIPSGSMGSFLFSDLSEDVTRNDWDDAIDSLSRIAMLDDNWDGEGALAPKAAALRGAILFLQQIYRTSTNTAPTRIVPDSDGAIIFEWQTPDVYIEARIENGDDVEWMIVPSAGSVIHTTYDISTTNEQLAKSEADWDLSESFSQRGAPTMLDERASGMA